MIQTNRAIMTHRRLLLLKWLMVFIPPVTVAVGHSLLEYRAGLLGPAVDSHAENPLVTLLVTFLALVLAYVLAETLFRVLRRLQGEALAREQAIITMNAVMQERERLSREIHDGVAQLVADLLLRLDTIKDLVEANRQQEAEAELGRLHGVADEIYEDIGDSIAGIRTNVTERGLVRALQDYVDQFEERHQIPTSLQVLTGPAPDAAGQPYLEVVESISRKAAGLQARPGSSYQRSQACRGTVSICHPLILWAGSTQSRHCR